MISLVLFKHIYCYSLTSPSFPLYCPNPSLCKACTLFIFLSSYYSCSSFCKRHEKLPFLWLVRAIQNNIGYFCCLWLSARVRREVTIDEDILYFGSSPQRIRAGSDLRASFLGTSSHRTRRCCVDCQSSQLRKTINSLTYDACGPQ